MNCESKWINAIRSLRKWIKMNQNLTDFFLFLIQFDEPKWIDSVRALISTKFSFSRIPGFSLFYRFLKNIRKFDFRFGTCIKSYINPEILIEIGQFFDLPLWPDLFFWIKSFNWSNSIKKINLSDKLKSLIWITKWSFIDPQNSWRYEVASSFQTVL